MTKVLTEGKTKTEVKQTDDSRHPITPPPTRQLAESSTRSCDILNAILVAHRKDGSTATALKILDAALGRERQVMPTGFGSTCSDCGFRYWEHEGHIVPCPLCRAEALQGDLDVLAVVVRTGAAPPERAWTDDAIRKTALRAAEFHAARSGADEALAEKLMRNLITTPDVVRLGSFRHEVLHHLTVGDLRRASEIIRKLSRI